MIESYPSWFWVFARFLQPLSKITDEMSRELQIDLLTSARHGVTMFLNQEGLPELLPRSFTKADRLQQIIDRYLGVMTGTLNRDQAGDLPTLRRAVEGFSVSLQDELDTLPTFTVVGKGNLDMRKLVKSASLGYPGAVLELIDDFMRNEIDYAGKCLAFELPTSCGFHILRAVEIGIKGYLHAKTGSLPAKMNQRNWGEYIRLLEGARAHPDLIDVLKVLKTKRNPLMHPQDTLEVMEAVSLLCICQAGIEALSDNVRKDSLDTKFKESLKLLPTL